MVRVCAPLVAAAQHVRGTVNSWLRSASGSLLFDRAPSAASHVTLPCCSDVLLLSLRRVLPLCFGHVAQFAQFASALCGNFDGNFTIGAGDWVFCTIHSVHVLTS